MHEGNPPRVYTLEEWLASSNISPKNKEMIRTAMASGMYGSLAELEFGRPEWFRDPKGRKRKSKVKFNPDPRNYLCETKSKCIIKRDKDPTRMRYRMICGQQPEVTGITGPALKMIQEWVEKSLSHNIFMAAGKTVEELDAWRARFRYLPGTRVATDMSNYDSLLKDESIDLVLRFYKRMYKAYPCDQFRLFWKVLKHQKRTMKFRTANGWTFGVRGTTKSGAYDTCLFNTLVNVFISIYGTCKACGIDERTLLSSDFHLAVMGDDNSMFIPAQFKFDRDAYMYALRRLGFDVKYEDDPRRVEIFLNMVPTPYAEADQSRIFDVSNPSHEVQFPTALGLEVGDAMPMSALEQKVALVAPMGSGKSTLFKKFGLLDPDDHFPKGHNAMSTRDKYQQYVSLIQEQEDGLFLFHDFSVVPNRINHVAYIDMTDEELDTRIAKRGSGDLELAKRNLATVRAQAKLRGRAMRIPLRQVEQWVRSSLVLSTKECSTLPVVRLQRGKPIVRFGAPEDVEPQTYTLLPGRGLARMTHTVSVVRNVDDFVSQVVECMWPAVAHHPIWNAFCERLWELHSPGRYFYRHNVDSDLNLKYKALSRYPRATSPRIWNWMSKRYEVTEQELRDCVEFLRQAKTTTNLSDNKVLVEVMSLDWRPFELT